MTCSLTSRFNPGCAWTCDIEEARQQVVDCSYPLSDKNKELTAFQCDPCSMNRLLDLDQGAAVDCWQLNSFIPHCHGTHTESAFHICPRLPQFQDEKETMRAKVLFPSPLIPCLILKSVNAKSIRLSTDERFDYQGDEDWVVDADGIHSALQNQFEHLSVNETLSKEIEAVLLLVRRGNNVLPYLTPESITLLFRHFPNLKHLLVNLPSVDREVDRGKLHAHWIFFSGGYLTAGKRKEILATQPLGENDSSDERQMVLKEKTLLGTYIPEKCKGMSITENCWVESESNLKPIMLLQLNVLGWSMDANPSRPLLYPASFSHGQKMIF